MTHARRTSGHRRGHAAREPAIGALAAAGLLAGAWYATAGAATPTAADLTVTTTAVSLPAKFPYVAAGYNNARDWNRTATAPYGKDRLPLSWESLRNAKCAAGTCTGTFTGTHLRPVDWNGKFASPGKVVNARITGDLAGLENGTLTWAYAPVTPSYATPLTGASPSTTSLRIARLTP
ncbi:hypothetical protein AB5J72_37775 [Streptomyces sp. CG1]|uniref:hypothetical protein n=1 Tax=Streptomyces sp. CG1 TaxID=1287523 RepID=UPI0034E1BE56